MTAFVMLLAAFSVSAWGQGGSARIVEVRYVGLQSVTPADLEEALPFSPGDAWKEEFAKSGTRLVSEYYTKRGFYGATVRISASRSEKGSHVIVDVDEGRPCLLESVFIDDPPRADKFKSKHVLLRFKARMESVLGLRSGDRYDERLVADRLRELREWLVEEGFILANTDKVRLTYNDDRTSVALVAAIAYGDRVSFGYQGNTVFTKGELNEMIAQLRATGLGKDYLGAIQRRFNDEYRNRAYNDIRVESRVRDTELARHITFEFNEGARTRLDEVRWEGLSVENIKTAGQVFARNAARLVQRSYYVERDVDRAIQIVLEDLRSRGFLSSKLIARSVQPVKTRNPGARLVRVLVQMAEGEQTLIGDVELEGVVHFRPEEIEATLGVSSGQPFNPFGLEEGLQRLRSRYVDDGFLDFEIVTPEDGIVGFSENNRTASVRVAVREGTRVRVGAVRIEGLDQTRAYVVERELSVEPEDWWVGSKVRETDENLRRLGIFSEVRIKPEASARGPGYRDMVILIKESEPGTFEAGPGFRSDLGARAFARVSYNNIMGKNWIGILSAEGNRRLGGEYHFLEYKTDATFIEPRFFGTRNLYSLGLSARRQRFPPDFNAETFQVSTGFERELKILPVTAKILYKLERVRQFDVYLPNSTILSPVDNATLLIGSIVPSVTVDSRDNPFTTTRGQVSSLSLEYANPRFAGQTEGNPLATGYYRWVGSSHWYLPVSKDIVWSNVFAGGFERSNIRNHAIPLIKLFRLGGYSSIRSFGEDSINVDTRVIKGTLTFLNFRTQFDLPLVGELRFAPFMDAGNLYVDELKNRPFFRAGAGAGLHYFTPIGPINFDYGFKLNPGGDDTPGQFHFSVGFI